MFQTARLEENFINQRVNQALCSAMDVLSKDKGICSTMQSCIVIGNSVTAADTANTITIGNTSSNIIFNIVLYLIINFYNIFVIKTNFLL